MVKLSPRAHFSLIIAACLGGCSSSPLPVADVVATAIRQREASNIVADSAQLNPAYRYLRVKADHQPPALLVLGYVNRHLQGDIEVWYSAKGEVIKVQRGRVVGTSGLKKDWVAMRYLQTPPDWTSIGEGDAQYERLRDERPGYKDDVLEKLQVRGVREKALAMTGQAPQGLGTQQLRWFTETLVHPSSSQLPTAWFAWGKLRGADAIVYSRQCLAEDFCLTLQAWPPEGERQ